MPTTVTDARPQQTRRSRQRDQSNDAVVAGASDGVPEPLDLLTDEYARDILTVLAAGPQTGRDLIDACGASRSTVYRRVNRLEDAGLVASRFTFDPDGHHRKEFRLVRDRLSITVADGEIEVVARPATDRVEG